MSTLDFSKEPATALIKNLKAKTTSDMDKIAIAEELNTRGKLPAEFKSLVGDSPEAPGKAKSGKPTKVKAEKEPKAPKTPALPSPDMSKNTRMATDGDVVEVLNKTSKQLEPAYVLYEKEVKGAQWLRVNYQKEGDVYDPAKGKREFRGTDGWKKQDSAGILEYNEKLKEGDVTTLQAEKAAEKQAKADAKAAKAAEKKAKAEADKKAQAEKDAKAEENKTKAGQPVKV
jgi:hypothetical protein